jgi:zinc transport system permease protein
VLTTWLQQIIDAITQAAPPGTFLSFSYNIKGLIAVILVGLICGAVGSLVVGNRMAFFSDAMAHCAFAGIALGLLMAVVGDAEKDGPFYTFGVPFVMVCFGALVGLGIAYVRENTSLASDTVIGVFFAGAIGFGAMLFRALSQRSTFNPENFLFGDLISIAVNDLLLLAALAVAATLSMSVMYNTLVFSSFNQSLARSRRVPLRLCNYLFILLLALIVNLCIKIVGALLINAFLIVPAATAILLTRNMRQMFWTTIGLTLLVGIGGVLLTWEIGNSFDLTVGFGGLIIVLSVFLFFAAMIVGPLLRNRRAA